MSDREELLKRAKLLQQARAIQAQGEQAKIEDSPGTFSRIVGAGQDLAESATKLLGKGILAFPGAETALTAYQENIPERLRRAALAGIRLTKGERTAFDQPASGKDIIEEFIPEGYQQGSLSDILPFLYSATGEGAALKKGGSFDITPGGVVETVTDPLTYLSGGAGAGAKAGIQGSGKLSKILRGVDTVGETITANPIAKGTKKLSELIKPKEILPLTETITKKELSTILESVGKRTPKDVAVKTAKPFEKIVTEVVEKKVKPDISQLTPEMLLALLARGSPTLNLIKSLTTTPARKAASGLLGLPSRVPYGLLDTAARQGTWNLIRKEQQPLPEGEFYGP